MYIARPGMPPVTKNLIIINLLVWLATIVLQRFDLNLQYLFGLHYLTADKFELWQFVSYMFLHSDSFNHVFFNMFAIFMFGRMLEAYWGSKRFLIYYFITGIGAALIQQLAWTWELREIVFSSVSMIQTPQGLFPKNVLMDTLVTVGASGSVFGVLLAFGMIFPNTPLYLLFIPIPIKAKWMVLGYGVLELVAGVANFSFDNVAHFAHLGGMLFGFFVIRYWEGKSGNNDRY